MAKTRVERTSRHDCSAFTLCTVLGFLCSFSLSYLKWVEEWKWCICPVHAHGGNNVLTLLCFHHVNNKTKGVAFAEELEIICKKYSYKVVMVQRKNIHVKQWWDTRKPNFCLCFSLSSVENKLNQVSNIKTNISTNNVWMFHAWKYIQMVNN